MNGNRVGKNRREEKVENETMTDCISEKQISLRKEIQRNGKSTLKREKP